MRSEPSAPKSLDQALDALPRDQVRAWGVMAVDHRAAEPVLILAPPSGSIAAAAREAQQGLPIQDNRYVFPFNRRSAAGGVVGAIGGALMVSPLDAGVLGLGLIAGGAVGVGAITEIVMQRANGCEVVPLPIEAAALACSIEHASAVARAQVAGESYDEGVIDCLREILWVAVKPDPSLDGALRPLARLLDAVLMRNVSVFGPHRLPYWYAPHSVDPASWPVALPAAEAAASATVAQLYAEAGLADDSDIDSRPDGEGWAT